MRYHLALTAALALQVSAAHADSIVALVGEDILATIDGRTAKTTGLVKIDGVGPVLGIDVRPSDGQLYALASDGTIATIDPGTGKATAKSKLDMLPRADIQIAVDFNPVADKLRIIGADGTNLRADVDSGKVTEDQSLKFAANDPAADQTPTIIAGAYSNSVKGAKETTLYDIDAGLGGLFRQAPPNDGVLNTIGKIGVNVDRIGLDIVPDGEGNNAGLLVANGKLYRLDLSTGKAVGGKIIVGLPSDVRDVAALLSLTPKQAANMMGSGAMGMRAGGETASTSMPRPMSDNMAARTSMPMQMKAKVAAPRNLQYRADYGMPKDAYSTPKMRMNGPQCNERRAQY
jgi:hypothetical protein